MLLIPARVGPSPIHGLGVFARADIARGTPTWVLTPPFDVVFTGEQLDGLAPITRAQIDSYVYFDRTLKMYVLCGDDARFYNHSDRPNTGRRDGDPRTDVALRDISAGEELVCDYRTFTDHPEF